MVFRGVPKILIHHLSPVALRFSEHGVIRRYATDGKIAVQKAFVATPTLLRPFAVAPFQLTPVGSSVLSAIPPNPAACLRMVGWDKTWDITENFSVTEGP